ncbi:type IV toxin-antitoxin system AbiEi family antitoxin domain-containing protein [Pseudomonas sp. W5-36]|uniref:type IV toxin-antitoxin system AbiEi family antitoxin domain-containing protein n=1 Tax=Pseudomonas sp. W5-36 TaxID=3097455 RepID=UPI003978A55E
MFLLEEALATWVLEDYPYSVITQKKLSEQIFLLFMSKSYKDRKISLIRKKYASNDDFNLYINRVEKAGILTRIDENKKKVITHYSENLSSVYFIKGKPEYSATEAVCAVYPYGYISKLNAMAWYGLTDRIPKVIRFTACSLSEWKNKSLSDLNVGPAIPFDREYFIPTYPKHTNMFGEELIISVEKDYVNPSEIRNSPLRVSPIGKTFIDMLRTPDECGGIDHVLDVYIEYAEKYFPAILKELKHDRTRKMDIARTGFVLQKVVGISHPQLNEWQQESKKTRGSSKVLVPGTPFSAIYDEDWSLSLNAESAHQYGNRH